VAAWWRTVDDSQLYLSMLVLGEIRSGIERARRHDPVKARTLERWLTDLDIAFGDRVLGIDRSIAAEWGRMSTVRPIAVVDGLLAATARTHGLTLVTRNAADVTGLGATVLNPFKSRR